MLPHMILGMIAILAGLLARRTSLGFWGGVFMQLFVSGLFTPFLGQMSVFPAFVVIFILNRIGRENSLRTEGKICPFSKEIRDECVAYFDEERIRRRNEARPRNHGAAE